MTRTPRTLAAVALTASLALTGAACGDDEDGDGATTDEEVGEIEDTVEDGADEVSEEVEEGGEELEGEG